MTRTYLMVLDGEENETMRVLLQQRLVCLALLDGGSHLGKLRLGWLLGHGLSLDVGRVDRTRHGNVLLVRGLEAELLDGRIAHLELF